MTNLDFPSAAITTAPRSHDAEIARIAARHEGVISTRQLRAIGMSSSGVAKRVQLGRLHVVHRKVYAVGHGSLSTEGTWHAAVMAVGDDAALSHVAAARAWKIWKRGTDRIDVVVGRRCRANPSGVHIHECRSLTRRDVTRRRRIRVTTVARTLLDLADLLTPWQLAHVMYEAAFRRLLRLRDVRDVIVRNRGRAAVTVLRRALELHERGSAGTRSDLEDVFLAAVPERGASEPLVNTHVPVGDGSIEVDFCWPALRLCIEVDGSGHARLHRRVEDAARVARLVAAGYEVVRVGPAGILALAERVARRVGGR